MKFRAVGVELFHAEGKTDRHDEIIGHFSQLCVGGRQFTKQTTTCSHPSQ
jgi:hypothetical protein